MYICVAYHTHTHTHYIATSTILLHTCIHVYVYMYIHTETNLRTATQCMSTLLSLIHNYGNRCMYKPIAMTSTIATSACTHIHTHRLTLMVILLHVLLCSIFRRCWVELDTKFFVPIACTCTSTYCVQVQHLHISLEGGGGCSFLHVCLCILCTHSGKSLKRE